MAEESGDQSRGAGLEGRTLAMARVGAVAEPELFRLGLRSVVSAEPDLVWAGDTGIATEALPLVRRESVAVLVMSLGCALASIRTLLREEPQLPILVLSREPARLYATRMMQLGARGFLSDRPQRDELVKAIRDLAAGLHLASDAAASPDAAASHAPHEKLSDREFQVFILIAGGKGVREVAQAMGLGLKSAETYRRRALAKLRLRGNSEMAYYAMKQGLIS
jgi:two-component system invasion response regulator UvrY